MAAIRMRRQPGKWVGPKGARIFTAALGAAALDAFIEREGKRGRLRRAAETTLGELIVSKLSAGVLRTRREGGFF